MRHRSKMRGSSKWRFASSSKAHFVFKNISKMYLQVSELSWVQCHISMKKKKQTKRVMKEPRQTPILSSQNQKHIDKMKTQNSFHPQLPDLISNISPFYFKKRFRFGMRRVIGMSNTCVTHHQPINAGENCNTTEDLV